jgi:two-component system, NtrC family, nitrogen regulation response regulator NtrX
MAYEILIVDDEADIRNVIADLLQDEGYQTRTAEDGEKAVQLVKQRRPHLVILDIWLGNSRFDGIKVLEIIQKEYPGLPTIMMSGHGNIETAVNAIKMGAYDYIEKPFKADRLLFVLKRALEASQLRRENQQLKQRVGPDVPMVGVSGYVSNLKTTIEKVANSNGRVFITGPTGSGKETVARRIHDLSPRAAIGPFLVLNCATINADAFDEELFGREDNGTVTKYGLLEQAQGGTLVLDEIADISPASQSKLARVIHESTLRRLGSDKAIEIDVRLISTTSKNIPDLVGQGLFREDLYYRLNVVPVKVVALSERRDDIGLLADQFLSEYSKKHGHPKKHLTEDAITILKSYDWPGNIRQLKNLIEWVMIMSAERTELAITADMFPPEIHSSIPSGPQIQDSFELLQLPLREARDYFEKKYLLSQVSRFSGNVSQTASFIGMERSALHRKLRSLGLKRTG